MKTSRVALSIVLALAAGALAQTDPGPRGGPPAGPPSGPPQLPRPLPGLSPAEWTAFQNGGQAFGEIENVPDGPVPRLNLDSCAGCHAHPTPGGSSPPLNPQVAVAVRNGAVNAVPPFIQQDGPVRVVRFKQGPNGPDGGVHDLFAITGRNDALAGCQIQQPDFSNANNLSFRIPAPTFGLGLIEVVPDSTLRANLAANAILKRQLGIEGRFNTSANDGTITRFRWKAQTKSLLLFAGEAYNVEMGVSNELFPQGREDNPACATTPSPDSGAGLAAGAFSDIGNQAYFTRFLAPPQPAPGDASIDNGRALFAQVGCALCHTPSLPTGNASSAALRQQAVDLYSDLALHRMGQSLNDGITQGAAQGRTGAQRPSGASATGCFCCTTAARRICCRRSSSTTVRGRRPTEQS